jgi:hypothetical protein
VIVRALEPRDYEATKVVYAEAFKRRDQGDRLPVEVAYTPSVAGPFEYASAFSS